MSAEGIEIDIVRRMKKRGVTRDQAIDYLIRRAEQESRDCEREIALIRYEADDELSEHEKFRIQAREQIISENTKRIILLKEAAAKK